MSQPKFPSYRLLPFCLITSHYSEFHCQLRPYSSESSCSTPLDSAHGVLLAGINKLTTLKLFLLAMCLYGCIFIVLVTLCWIISGFPTSFEPEGLRLATVGVAASTCQVESINNCWICVPPCVAQREVCFICSVLLAYVQLASAVTPEVVVGGDFQVPVCTSVWGYSARKYSFTGLPFLWIVGVFPVSSLPQVTPASQLSIKEAPLILSVIA